MRPTTPWSCSRTSATLAFLDHRPLFPGHTLLVPRAHIETLLDLPDDVLPELFANARLLARAMEEALGAEGSFVAINNRVSQSVPHLHVHVVPRRRKDGLRGFFWPRQKYEATSTRGETRTRLRKAIADYAHGRPAWEPAKASPASRSASSKGGGMAVEQALQQFKETETRRGLLAAEPEAAQGRARPTTRSRPSSARWSPTRAR